MADLLLIRAQQGAGGTIAWSFVDEAMRTQRVMLDELPGGLVIKDGDVWHVRCVRAVTRPKGAVVRLVAKVSELQPWERVKALKDHWIDPEDLQAIITWLNTGTDVALIGPKGAGKTSLAFALTAALGWQDPCKVDVYTLKRTSDLFGSDAAAKGSSRFIRSALAQYIEAAQTAYEKGLDSHFLLLLDELNRVHAKSNESLHGLFDDTRQVSFTTSDGTVTIKLPPNLHTVATLNQGVEYVGTYGLDPALKDRFASVRVRPMPPDYEVAKLGREVGITEAQALAIVRTANNLRAAERSRMIGFAPSYRGCRNAARLLKHGMPLKAAVERGFLGWYEGELNAQGQPVDASSELAKARTALAMQGVQDVAA